MVPEWHQIAHRQLFTLMPITPNTDLTVVDGNADDFALTFANFLEILLKLQQKLDFLRPWAFSQAVVQYIYHD